MSRQGGTDWDGVAIAVCITLVIILTAGDPDLLGAIIHRVMGE